MKWVAIAERLPEPDELVDLWIEDGRGYEHHGSRQWDCWRQAHKNGDGWIWMRRGYNSEIVVRNQQNATHWLKIDSPYPPES